MDVDDMVLDVDDGDLLADDNLFSFDEENSGDDDEYDSACDSKCSDSMILCFEDPNGKLSDTQPPDFAELEDDSIGIVKSQRFDSRDLIIDEIERLMEQQVDVLLDQSSCMSLSLKTVSRNKCQNPGQSQAIVNLQTYRFPGQTVEEAQRFMIFRLLIMIHEALTSNVIVTKRDLYYRDPQLFRSQRTVDRYIDAIARTFGVSRTLLNVTGTAKGLAAGAFTLKKFDGSSVKGCDYKEGFLLSSMENVEKVDVSTVKWILVVEKEASFRSLIESSFWNSTKNSAVLVTAKGYPDLLTREFLQLIGSPTPMNNNHCCPVFGLFDYDPYGFGIMHTYKYGSPATAHECITTGHTSMQWLGLKSSDVFITNEQSQHGLIRLSPRDRRRASLMLKWPAFSEGGPEAFLRKELQVMLFMNQKAEIQVMEAFPGGLSARLMDFAKSGLLSSP